MTEKFIRLEPVWTRKPENFGISDKEIFIVTEPYTDLWQRTYYGFCNDSAPVLQARTDDEFFSFTVKTAFDGKRRFDQCGVAVYIDGNNWLKASVERENDEFQRLGSVVTNGGYSDWATTDIPASVNEMWYRLSRRGLDFRIEYSYDGADFRQMRICRLAAARGSVPFGIYACSPEESSFTARFSDMTVTDCLWQAHK